ncbi:unnamed protein product [Caenorhabditis sp. 36 PRJEB53466]|nr:unnamed protein product [Caenorhabditis sp. 36 PRJEB53466]
MSLEQMETAYSQTIENVLEVIGHSTAAHLPLLGEKAIDITNLRDEYEKPMSQCMSPLLNDSMLLHRNRLSRTSKSRLNMLRGSPMEVDRHSLSSPSRIGAIVEASTFLDTSIYMDESTNERGFLADVSDMNGTVRSRMPSFNFDQISPVSTGRTHRRSILHFNRTLDFDADASAQTVDSRQTIRTLGRFSASGEHSNSTIVLGDDGLHTPRRAAIPDTETTPTNVWNVKLRPGSNRKICEEIRREIQRQLRDESEDKN